MIINEMAQSMLDKNQEEAIGRNLLSILDVEEDVTLRRILENQDDMLVNSKQNGIPIILRASFSLIQRESGFISGIVCVLHDVTEQERIEEERKQFVSNVSHELRTPLTSMRSYIEALADGAWQDPDLAPRFLEVTQNETDRMIRMIQDLLHLSRIDSGKSVLNLEIVDMTEMLEHVLNRFDMVIHSAEYEGKDYQIRKDILQESVFVEVDPDRMIQVLDNIMNNAIKYSPDGGTITGKMEKRYDTVLISIRDEGMGIPKADLNKIFSRFYRVDRARSRAMGGSGLGLAISKEVVEQHGGRIWAESTEGKGTTFYLSLPYVPYEEEEWE
jgi:two-component system sensor histidine kinase VicK